MVTFTGALVLLIIGYFIYGTVVERTFGADSHKEVPSRTDYDGVDFLPMPTWKVFLIQFLNIAGTGPIFGAILGILFGPAAYLWIVLGCIFGGAVHDYMVGMLSMRKHGASLPEIVGDELGYAPRIVVRIFSLALLLLVGTVFATTPAGLLAHMVGGESLWGSAGFWVTIIFAYYILATLLPIDKLIGRIYPLFGIALLIMAAGVGYGIFTAEGTVPELIGALTSHHPSTQIPLFPGICITIACGAVSGFHATQSPLMARCATNEKYGRPIFYGAMVTEGIVALVWAAGTIKFADAFDISTLTIHEGFNADLSTPYGRLWAILTDGGAHGANPAIIVNTICQTWLGKVGALLAVLGVIAAPITSGDTAFRSARLIAADFLSFKQDSIKNRLLLTIPMFAASAALMFLDFSVLWRYFAWFNQTLAALALWTATIWLARRSRNYWIALIPTLWMTMVSLSYVMVAPAPEGFAIQTTVAYPLAAVITAMLLIIFFRTKKTKQS